MVKSSRRIDNGLMWAVQWCQLVALLLCSKKVRIRAQGLSAWSAAIVHSLILGLFHFIVET